MVVFSIITPCYKGQKYIPGLINSAEKNFIELKKAGVDAEVELILVNDYPADTLIIPEYSENIDVKVVNHEKNSGIHQARVTGLKAARGEFVYFLDQDDETADNFLLRQYNALGDADFVIANGEEERADGTRIPRYKRIGSMEKAADIDYYARVSNPINSPGQCLIRKASIPVEWSENIMTINGSDDMLLWVLMLHKKAKVALNNEVLYVHKDTGVNLSSQKAKMSESSRSVIEILDKIDYVPKNWLKDFIRNREFYYERSTARGIKKLFVAVKYFDFTLLMLKNNRRAKRGEAMQPY